MRSNLLTSLVALTAIVLFSCTTTALAASLVNINTADAALLDTLPGIGPTKAAAIVDYRTTHGLFATIEHIQDVKGIGPATFANMKSQITVGVGAAPAAVAPKAQPSPTPVSYNKTQPAHVEETPASKVESITSTEENIQHNEEGVIAPTAATELAAVGAPVAPLEHSSRAGGLLHSPWLFGLVGVIVLASGAFILL